MSQIRKTLDLSKSTVQTIIRNFNTIGCFTNKARSGRPPKLNSQNQRNIRREVSKHLHTTAKALSDTVKTTCHINVHPETIRRCLKKAGLKAQIPKKKPFISNVNKQKRELFANKYHRVHEENSDFWRRVLFTDECKFNVFGKDGRNKVWKKKNEAFKSKIIPTVK